MSRMLENPSLLVATEGFAASDCSTNCWQSWGSQDTYVDMHGKTQSEMLLYWTENLESQDWAEILDAVLFIQHLTMLKKNLC